MTHRVLACLSSTVKDESGAYFDPTSSVSSLASLPHASGVEVKVLSNVKQAAFEASLAEFKPTFVYIGSGASFEGQNAEQGALLPFSFKDGPEASRVLEAIVQGKGIETLYIDAKFDADKAKSIQGAVQTVISWASDAPATIAAQFAHTFFSILLTYAAAPNESFALASNVTKAHCTGLVDGLHVPPTLPSFETSNALLKTELPDSNSIPPVDHPDVQPSQPISSVIPGWTDLRLLAPRAEMRLLLTGSSSLIDTHKLGFLGEALRALLVLETRNATVTSSGPCPKTPMNLQAGSTALRCEVKTASGRQTVVVLGGPPDVLQNPKLVEHAVRMTLVADSQSLQFRLPPPGVSIPAPKLSAAIAGGAPVVDALVLTSVWAIQVIRWMCQDADSLGLISLGVGAVGISATQGVTAADAQRLKMVASGLGPSSHPAIPLPDVNPPAAPAPPALAAPAAEEAAKVDVAKAEGEAMEVDLAGA